MTTRFVALDLETTSLDPECAQILELAAIMFDPNDPGVYDQVEHYVPHHHRRDLESAEPEALAVNRYYERRLFAQMLDPVATDHAVSDLVDLLTGATLVCANPAFDSAVLWNWLRRRRPELTSPPWHHRMFDVSLATAVLLGLDEIPGLRAAADLLGLDYTPDLLHSAAGDAFLAADVCATVWQRSRPAEPERAADVVDQATYPSDARLASLDGAQTFAGDPITAYPARYADPASPAVPAPPAENPAAWPFPSSADYLDAATANAAAEPPQ